VEFRNRLLPGQTADVKTRLVSRKHTDKTGSRCCGEPFDSIYLVRKKISLRGEARKQAVPERKNK